jgi:eukaryotic-like serine/threonine-protein kinase
MDFAEHEWRSLSRLLDTVLSLPREARQSWLESLTVEHDSIKPLLIDLLAREDLRETGDFLATLPKFMDHSPNYGADVAIGQIIGPYRLLQSIGSGGMGSVWLAERVDGQLKRKVALKLPHVGIALSGWNDRIARERDFLATLEHPNIARLYDAGLAADGRPYLALEYVEGEPIDSYCEHRNSGIAERLKLVLQVADAVAFAHAHLIVHRDLKPSNILVDAQGQVHLLDFGIAKLLVADSAAESQLTQLGGRALTLEYASPEQIRGDPVGTPSDVYSLGVVLYNLLTGASPYGLKGHRGAVPLAQAILTVEPVRPSDAIVGSATRRKLRGDLDTIVLKTLKKNPLERYTAVVELADDIQRYLRAEPVRARPDSAWYRTRKFVSRNTLPVAVAGVALMTVLVAATIALVAAHIATSERDRAIALSARAEAATDFQNTLITEAAQSDKPVTVVDMLARSETLAKAEFRDRPENLAVILSMLGSNYHTMGQDSRAEPLLHDAVQAIQRSADVALRAELTCRYALVVGALGKTAEAKQSLHAVIDDPKTDLEQSAQCIEDLAYLAQNENDANSAMRYGTLAWQRLQHTPHVSAVAAGTYLGSIGYAYYLNNRLDEADRYYRQALEKFVQAGRGGSADAISVRNNWAIVSDGAGNPKKALELYDQTLQIVSQNGSGATPPTYLIANRARALENIGLYSESRATYARCVEESTKVGNPAATAYCLVGECGTMREVGDLAAARVYCNQAAALVGTSVPSRSPSGQALQIVRARIALSEGRLDEARDLLDEVIDKQLAVNATALIARADVNLQAGRLAEAESDARTALARAQSLQAGLPFSSKTGLAWFILARVLTAQGDKEHAAAALKNAVENLSQTVDSGHPALRSARQLMGGDGTAT